MVGFPKRKFLTSNQGLILGRQFPSGNVQNEIKAKKTVCIINLAKLNKEIWENWINNFEWIQKVSNSKGWNTFKWESLKEMESKGWDIHKLQIEKPATIEWINRIEKTTNQTFPDDFKTVLTQFSSAVRINWHMNDDNVQEFNNIFCGAGYGYVWDAELLIDIYEDYQGWLQDCWTDPNDAYGGIYYDKVPFIAVPNGDLIAFNKEIIDGKSEVIYLSHDDGELHGKRLAKNFVEFIDKWSNIGLAGTEEWQMSPFYDYEKEELSSDNEQVRLWKLILNK